MAVDARHRVQSRSRFEQPVMRALRIAAQAVTHHCFNKFFVSASEREVRPPDAFCLAAVECERAQKEREIELVEKTDTRERTRREPQPLVTGA